MKIILYSFLLGAVGVQQCESKLNNTEVPTSMQEKKVNEKPAEVLADGFQWAEGPVWVSNGSYLLFSDPRRNTIFKWKEGEGLTEFLKPSGYAGEQWYSDEPGTNGLLINQQGELIACDHGNRRIVQIDLESKEKATLIDRWEGRRFNSPNDIAQHPGGSYYFTDPPYGLPDREQDTLHREIAENGVYRVTRDGSVKQVIGNLARPNGIAVSPKGDKLYVALSDGQAPYIMAYTIKENGDLEAGSIFFDFKKQFPEETINADGIKVDPMGNLFAAAGNGVVIMDSSGKLLGRIETGVHTANCAFGDDGYLYMTSKDKLQRIKLPNVANL